MAKNNSANINFNFDDGTPIGRNITSWLSDGMLYLAIDVNKSGPQTKGSQEPGKAPNQMVASTSTFIPYAGGRLMLHFTRPMEVKDMRRARAEREIDAEDADASALLAKLAKENPEVRALLAKAGK